MTVKLLAKTAAAAFVIGVLAIFNLHAQNLALNVSAEAGYDNTITTSFVEHDTLVSNIDFRVLP